MAVVAEPYGPRLGQLDHLGQLRALAPFRHRADGEHSDHSLVAGLVQHELDGRPGVHDRARVRHGADRREASSGGGQRARGNRLLVLEAGLPQVAVQIDEPGAHDEAGRIDDLRILTGDSRADPGYRTVLDQQVGDPVEALGWVDYAPAAYQYRPCVSHGFRASQVSP